MRRTSSNSEAFIEKERYRLAHQLRLTQLFAVLLKHLFKDVIDFVDTLHNFPGCLSLRTEIPNYQEKRGHSVEVSNRFPTHCLLDVKKNAIPAIEPFGIDDRLPKHSPCPLEVRKDCFFVSGAFCRKCHF